MTRRRFNRRERTALYLAADGKCQECGVELQPAWHGDHVIPHSRGGETDVINGQALCPACNLKKGSTVTQLRAWQESALGRLLGSSGDFLTVATPGAGKTTFALTAAQRLIERGEAGRIIVVVPTTHLRVQWANAAAALGVQLDHRFENGAGALAKDFDGLVVTYHAVASSPLLYRKMTSDARTFVVLDEVHHGGQELAWGVALREAFDPAVRRLLLSGTPFRSDGAPIPFVRYDGAGKCIADYSYDYGTALRDRSVVRPVEFLALDGSVRWREAGAVVAVDLEGARDETLVNALKAALNPGGDWIASVLRRADEELTRHRGEVPDAAGLVVASDQHNARLYARLLASICGAHPALAISDEPDASSTIAQFARGKGRWIVAVQMVSEGVDIPRLAVGVYASRTRTELFFRQVVGRLVRTRGPEDTTTATLLVPSIDPLLGYAQRIEAEADEALREDRERLHREVKETQASLRFDLVEPIDSSEAIHRSTITSGEVVGDDELRRAEQVMQVLPGLPATLTVAQVALLGRALGAGRVVGSQTVNVEMPPLPMADQKAALKRLIKNKVGRLNRITERPFSHIHAELNRLCGDKASTATVETLERRLALLDEWTAEAQE